MQGRWNSHCALLAAPLLAERRRVADAAGNLVPFCCALLWKAYMLAGGQEDAYRTTPHLWA
jgi:hypothetical protein